jgi:hypothetical protein
MFPRARRHEKLHRSVLLDHADRLDSYRRERDALEDLWISRANAITDDQRWDLTQDAFIQARHKTDEWINRVQLRPLHRQNKWAYRRYWQRQNAQAGLTVK